jgi:two-component system, NarL family, nitrate/nitrite response regulator NarL
MEASSGTQRSFRDSQGTAATENRINADEGSRSEECFRVLVSVCSEMGRRGICTMLQPIPEVCEIEACADLDEAAELIQDRRFNVLMLSASPDTDELERIAIIADKNDVRVVVLLHSLDEDATPALGDLSVDGFLLEEDVTEHSLREGLASLARGEMAMPGRLARRLLSSIRAMKRAEIERPFLLTPREHQALMLLADGMSNKQIARRLGISEHGAKRHVANVLAKLNCPNRTLAVALALRYGLLSPEEIEGGQGGNALLTRGSARNGLTSVPMPPTGSARGRG